MLVGWVFVLGACGCTGCGGCGGVVGCGFRLGMAGWGGAVGVVVVGWGWVVGDVAGVVFAAGELLGEDVFVG
ncbi:hypothetical protein GCM10009804_73850 [Kribbella hippodromi]|uniref:Uncharacterized protein n=1 Tax=Kribbella hippodromi TaxID=434347 RepID=A0ABN2EIG7_9ACTN